MVLKIKELSNLEKLVICKNNYCSLCALNIEGFCCVKNSLNQIQNYLGLKKTKKYFNKKIKVTTM